MKPKNDISPEELRELISCNPLTGELLWKEREPARFTATPGRSAAHQCSLWNSRWAGKSAVAQITAEGYLQGRILGRSYCAHRIVWAIAKGEWPKGYLDHINGIRSDNRIQNLRDVDDEGNARNAAIRHDNSSGQQGVFLRRSTGRWHAQIGNKYLGSFRTFAEAVSVRKAAEVELDYHPNHGRRSALKNRCEQIRKARAA